MPSAPPLDGRRACATLEIDLDALVANFRTLASLADGAAPAAVVKCNAYGLGAAPVARALRGAGCTLFYVAHAFEGACVRAAIGADAQVFVLDGPVEDDAPFYSAHDLVPVLNSPGQAETWRKAARAAGRALPAVLHVDTGMNRLGFSLKEFAAFLDAPGALDGLALDHVMSHLACSSTPDDPKNAEQLAAFTAERARLAGVRASFAASAGVHIGPDYACDIVRLGIGVFGASPFDAPGPAPGLKTVATWRAPILQVRDVQPGETAGYGATRRFTAPARLAVVSSGYGDGYPRSQAAGGRGWFSGVYLPVAGRVSMDLTTFDATRAPQDTLRPGALIELMGANAPVEEIAERAATAPYEILTGLGARLNRRYLSDGAAFSD